MLEYAKIAIWITASAIGENTMSSEIEILLSQAEELIQSGEDEKANLSNYFDFNRMIKLRVDMPLHLVNMLMI